MSPRARGCIAALTAVLLATPAAASPEVAARASSFLHSIQDAEGRFGTITSADGVAEAVGALTAAGARGAGIERALGLIARDGPARAQETGGRAGRIVLGLVAAGRDPRAFADTDYVAVLRGHYNPLTGEFDGTNLYANALGALGWFAAQGTLPERARTFILTNECPGGGFGWRTACAGGADADTTAIVLIALARAGGADAVVTRARQRLAALQHDDGGFGQPGAPTNANSTGLALGAIAVLGEDPAAWSRGGGDPVEALLRLEAAGGGFRYVASQRGADGYATVQALPGLLGRAWPITPAAGARPDPAPPRETAEPGRTAPGPSATRASDEALAEPGPEHDARAQALGARQETPPEPIDGARSRFPIPTVVGVVFVFLIAGVVAWYVERRRS